MKRRHTIAAAIALVAITIAPASFAAESGIETAALNSDGVSGVSVPGPVAAWLFGAALIGTVLIGRRQHHN